MKIGMPKDGRFGNFGGKYIPETLVPAVEELEENYQKIKNDKNFQKEFDYYLKNYAGRPTPLYYAKNLTKSVGGAKIYLKREDLLHGGAHKINNTLGQALLAKKMKKKRIIAETGAGNTVLQLQWHVPVWGYHQRFTWDTRTQSDNSKMFSGWICLGVKCIL